MIPGTASGEIHVCGEDTRVLPVWKRADHVGLVFQDFETQLIGTTIGAELRHPMEYREVPLTAHEMHQRMTHALSAVGLDVDLDRDPLRMSGGQRQRLVMASVVVQKPQLLILDEPSSDLDPASRTQFRQMLQHWRNEGLSVLMTEQDHGGLQLADRVILLDEGKLVWEGQPTMLLRDPQLMRQHGIRPLALTECFEGQGCDSLPLTLEEAWAWAEKLHLMLDPPQEVLNDTVRLGKTAFLLDVKAEPIIQIDDVSFQYEGHRTLEDINCVIHHGEFLALLGANGSGKSTLARLINGLLSPTKGRILVDAMDTCTASMSELARRVGLVFQNPDHQIFANTVWEEVAFGAKNLGCSQDEIAVRVQESLHAVGLSVEKSGGLDPFSLRKGERQRVAVASILATRSTLLIFDEPTTGLDAPETDRMMAMISELHRQGHSIVMITHSMALVAEYAQRCLMMEGGRIVADGSPRDIFQDPILVRSAEMEIPPIARFSQRWGYTLLTVNEVKASLKPNLQ
jgi:energy-coupling factor transport system ATP-binding protein